jgi:hypothetical protein
MSHVQNANALPMLKKAIADADNPERIAEIAATKADAKQKAAKAKAKPVAKKESRKIEA